MDFAALRSSIFEGEEDDALVQKRLLKTNYPAH